MAKSFLNMPQYPRGLRNNNPGNLRDSGDSWRGMLGIKDGFIQFENIAYGLRALAIDLKTKISRGYDTIELLIFRYAPPSENDTLAYISRVVQMTGIAQNRTLQADPATLAKLIYAIVTVEIGTSYSGLITASDINEGISMMSGSVVNTGTVGFSLATGLFLLSLYLLYTMPKLPKKAA